MAFNFGYGPRGPRFGYSAGRNGSGRSGGFGKVLGVGCAGIVLMGFLIAACGGIFALTHPTTDTAPTQQQPATTTTTAPTTTQPPADPSPQVVGPNGKTEQVSGYFNKNGKWVEPYNRRPGH